MAKPAIRFLRWALVAAALPVALGPAQEPSAAARYVSPSRGVTAAEAARTLVGRNKELEAARELVRQAEARLEQARLRPNPSLTFEHTTDRMFANEGESDTSVGLSHPFELGGKRAKRIALARTGIELARAELEDRTIRLVFRLRALFGDALAAAERVDLIERQEKLNQETLGVMEVRLRAGDASRLESSLLAASTRQLEAERVAVEDDLARVVLEVKTLAGMAPAEELVLRGTLELPPLAATRDGALEVALRERPDVRAARQREALADAGIEVARAQAIPNLSAFVRFGKENNVIEGLLPPREIIVEREKRLSFGLEIPLPLFNRQQGTIGEAISRRSQARAEREGVEAAARRDVLDAYRRYEAMRRVLELYTRGVLAESQESFRIVSLAYRLGELRLLDVLQQQRLHLDSQRGYASAKHAYYTAVVDLERAMGKWPLVEGSR